MRPTDLHFRPPREKTAEFLKPQVRNIYNHADRLSIRKLMTEEIYHLFRQQGVFESMIERIQLSQTNHVSAISEQVFFFQYMYIKQDQVRRTGAYVGPSSYKQDQHTMEVKPRRGPYYKTLNAGPQPTLGCYSYSGNHIVFDASQRPQYQKHKASFTSSMDQHTKMGEIARNLSKTSINRSHEKLSIRRVLQTKPKDFDGISARDMLSQTTATTMNDTKSARGSYSSSSIFGQSPNHIRSATNISNALSPMTLMSSQQIKSPYSQKPQPPPTAFSNRHCQHRNFRSVQTLHNKNGSLNMYQKQSGHKRKQSMQRYLNRQLEQQYQKQAMQNAAFQTEQSMRSQGATGGSGKHQQHLSQHMTPLQLNRLRCQQPRQYVNNPGTQTWNTSMALGQKKKQSKALSNVMLYSSQERVKNKQRAKNGMVYSQTNNPFMMDQPSSNDDLEQTPIFSSNIPNNTQVATNSSRPFSWEQSKQNQKIEKGLIEQKNKLSSRLASKGEECMSQDEKEMLSIIKEQENLLAIYKAK